jgi:hypothetical protein
MAGRLAAAARCQCRRAALAAARASRGAARGAMQPRPCRLQQLLSRGGRPFAGVRGGGGRRGQGHPRARLPGRGRCAVPQVRAAQRRAETLLPHLAGAARSGDSTPPLRGQAGRRCLPLGAHPAPPAAAAPPPPHWAGGTRRAGTRRAWWRSCSRSWTARQRRRRQQAAAGAASSPRTWWCWRPPTAPTRWTQRSGGPGGWIARWRCRCRMRSSGPPS